MSKPSRIGWLIQLNNCDILAIISGNRRRHQPVIAVPFVSLPPDFGREIHTPQLLAGNVFKTAALCLAGPVFYFDKIYNPAFLGDNINLANPGLPVAVNNFKTLML
jgi:hypothetical protein